MPEVNDSFSDRDCWVKIYGRGQEYFVAEHKKGLSWAEDEYIFNWIQTHPYGGDLDLRTMNHQSSNL
jgi:hypothetical protein